MNRNILIIIIAIIITATLASCGNFDSPQSVSTIDNPDNQIIEYSLIGMYDSIDTAIVEAIDAENKTITLINFILDKTYTLEYSGTTTITDKFGQAMAMSQINMGDIVDVFFLKDLRRLTSLNISPDAFAFENVTRYSLNSERKSAIIGEENFRLTSSTLIVSDDRKIEAADIIYRDIVTIRGIDRDILSVVVQKGHGYLRLMNDAYAIGGWIEIGQTMIHRITDGMLLTVPEGVTEIYISARGFSTARKVTIERNKETVIDLGDIEIETPMKGRVVFSISPATATVYIEGTKVDTSKVIELDFGLHQIVCEASGYDTITQYIKVSQDIASVNITMDPSKTNQDNVDSGSNISDEDNGNNSNNSDGGSVSGNSLAIGANRIYIDAPTGVEVYQNGVYVGISPVYFEKKTGSHTITFRREGYVTKSYTIYADDTTGDVTYSFSALEKNVE
jgi:hypothetical protein